MVDNQENSSGDQRYEKIGEFVAIFTRNGNWYANYQHNNRQVRRALKTRSKKEARRRALIIEKEVLTGEHKHLRRAPLLKEVVDQYLKHLQSEGRVEKTIGKYRYCFDLRLKIAARRNTTRISQVDLGLVDQYRAERATGCSERKPAKPKTIHNDTVTIRQLVNFALRRGMISDDPLKALKILKSGRTPQPCWTRDEVDRILDEAQLPHGSVLAFLAETGARVGEAKWLQSNDVDLSHRLIHIRPKDGWKPKSGDERVVPISDRLFEMFPSTRQDAGWVFTARVTSRHPERDRQISERRLLQYLKRLLKRLGLRGHLHTFRHSFISFAAYEGVSERVLRKWIGHVDREILDWYFHLADSQSQEAMKRLSDAANKNKSSKEAPGTDSNPAQSQHNEKGDQDDKSAK